MQEIQELVHKHLLHAWKAQKRQVDRHHRDVDYTVGQKVLLNTGNLRSKLPRKLQDWYVGPFEVLKRVGPTAYKLDRSHNSALKTIHPVLYISILRDFEDNGLRQQPPPVEIDGQYEFQIEALVAYRISRGQPQYYVSSVSYDASENVWLAEQQVSNAKELLSEFCLVHGL